MTLMQALRGEGTGMGKETTRGSLWRRVGELGTSSAFLMYLAEAASSRLSLTQAAFFMLAAAADAAGKPATRNQLLSAQGTELKASIRNSYRQLLEADKVYPDALGWLYQEPNPEDKREAFLRLTPKGKKVVIAALSALSPATTNEKVH